MKKYFICLMLAVMAMGVKAQTTWNVRAGAGTFGVCVSESHGSGYEYIYNYISQEIGPALAVECNIPLKKAGRYIFSPSICAAVIPDNSDVEVMSLWHFGYKVLGDGFLFVPKLGSIMGYCFGDSETVLLGPSTEMAFEIKHFVIALNAYVDLVNDRQFGAFLTFGYKF